MRLFDAHNHFQDEFLLAHRAALAERLPGIGLVRAVVNGTHENDWHDVAALARAHEWVVPSFGLHPWHCGARTPDWRRKLEAALAAHPGAGLGEIGLDRWILDRARADDPRRRGLTLSSLDEQAEVFREQLELAAAQNRACTIHCLDAFGRLLQILQDSPRPARGFLLHAYGGSAEMLPRFAELGAYFSFNGHFLAARAAAKRQAFAQVAADRLLVETDAPAMPLPEELQRHPLANAVDGQRVGNPLEIATTYEHLARLRATSGEQLAEQVEQNFRRFFGPM